jgi:hypothetical protein
MNDRPLCSHCKLKPCAVNYYRNDRVYYRKKCVRCQQLSQQQAYTKPLWQRQGYQKKNRCDRCGHHSEYSQVFSVYCVDGNLKNTLPTNLRTVCANCQITLSVKGVNWHNAELISDF